MKRTTSSFNPLASVSISISVTKPYLYFSRSATVFSVSARADILVFLLRRGARTGARNEFVEGREHRVRIRLFGIPAKAHAQRAVRWLVGDAHGRQHMRGADLAGRTGRTGAHANAIEIERHQRRFRGEAGDREIRCVAEAWRLRAEDDRLGPAAQKFGFETIAKHRLPRNVCTRSHDGRRRTKARDTGDVVRAAAFAALLSAAGNQRRKRRAFLDDQSAGAL